MRQTMGTCEISPRTRRCIAFACLVAFATSAAPLQAECVVTSLRVSDYSRTTALPFESPATRGATPAQVQAMVWSRGAGGQRPSYAALVQAAAPGVDPAEHLVSRLRFYGATVDSSNAARVIETPTLCVLHDALPAAPRGGIALIVGAFPAVLYEGAAARLAEHDIATVVTTGGEAGVRLILNHLAGAGWPVDRVALIGHGAGGPVVQLIAMSSSSVRALVSLDGFEALDPRRHPGLTGDAAWRPGNLRAPVLHFRPNGHPDADSSHHVAAGRSALFQITMTAAVGRQWLTAPEAALAPPALQPLIGVGGGAMQQAVTDATVSFVASALTDQPIGESALRALLPPSFVLTHRPALATPAIRTDGRLTESIWASARTLQDNSAVRVRVSDDCDFVYLAVVPSRSAPFITEVFVDIADADSTAGESTPRRELGRNLLLHASASLCWVIGAPEVAAAHCNRNEAWWGASRTSQAGDPPIGEYFVAKRSIGLRRCQTVSALRLGALVGGWGARDVFPVGAEKTQPGTWARIGTR